MTYPEIGNYGVNPHDPESRRVFAAGLIVGEALTQLTWNLVRTGMSFVGGGE